MNNNKITSQLKMKKKKDRNCQSGTYIPALHKNSVKYLEKNFLHTVNFTIPFFIESNNFLFS